MPDDLINSFMTGPDENGRFGQFGGRFVSETLMPLILDLEAEYEKAKDPWFYVSCGSGWFHYEGSWLTDPSIPYSYIKDYVQRLENGDSIERSLDQIEKQRDEIVAEYRKLIKTDEDRKAFDDAYNTIRTIYRYAEDHLFWVEHWFHTIWFDKIRELGKVLVDNGMLNEVDDIFMFNRYEIPQLLTEVSTGWALGVDTSVDWKSGSAGMPRP